LTFVFAIVGAFAVLEEYEVFGRYFSKLLYSGPFEANWVFFDSEGAVSFFIVVQHFDEQ
jgi:hypothetical protein